MRLVGYTKSKGAVYATDDDFGGWAITWDGGVTWLCLGRGLSLATVQTLY